MAQGTPEIPNFITLLIEGPTKDLPFVHFLHHYENQIFTVIASILMLVFLYFSVRKLSFLPNRLQAFVEMLYEMLLGLVEDMLGKSKSKIYFPYISSLFLFILASNLLGLIPLFKSPTSSYMSTLPLALMTFFYVQWTALTKLGPKKYLYHLSGEPQDIITYALSPFMFVLHVIAELARPLSLSLRLFGNIFGEDVLLGVMASFGVIILTALSVYMQMAPLPIGIPLQLPFYALSILTSIVQALVFTLLTTTYISMALPHDEAEESH